MLQSEISTNVESSTKGIIFFSCKIILVWDGLGSVWMTNMSEGVRPNLDYFAWKNQIPFFKT